MVHQLPPDPAYLRVKVRRRLQAIGAVALKNSVYVLPALGDALEDFQWLRRMIDDEGASATIMSANFIEGMTDAEVQDHFNADRDVAYAEIAEAARRPAQASASEAEISRVRRQLARVAEIDFFGAPGRADAERAVAELVDRASGRTKRTSDQTVDVSSYLGRPWVTRAGVFIDRLSCAWLIRRFIDPDAHFRFVSGRDRGPDPGEITFDMYEGTFTHQAEACTFEVMAARFRPGDARLRAMGEIVHDIDCKEDAFGRPETAGVLTAVKGVVNREPSDMGRIEAAMGIFDALYAGLGG